MGVLVRIRGVISVSKRRGELRADRGEREKRSELRKFDGVPLNLAKVHFV
jgi:hypothetical protein